MNLGEVTTIGLTRKLAREHASDLLGIDEPHVVGGRLELWHKDNFLSEKEDKWRLSVAAIVDQVIVGYRIVSSSGRVDGCCHSHRAAVQRDLLRRGIGKKLLIRNEELAEKFGYRGITAYTLPNDVLVGSFFRTNGFQNIQSDKANLDLWVKLLG